jgi:hypothetical protein
MMLLAVIPLAQAQTPVTTAGGTIPGTTGGLPVFTGGATLGGSSIMVPTFSNGLGGIYLRTPPSGQQNTVVDPRLLYEGIASGDGSAATPWGLNISSVPWSWSQDPMTFHAGFYVFRNASGNGPEIEAMRINYGGNVGIGTASPGAMLEVNGNVKLTAGSGASITFPDNTIQSTAWNGTLYGGDYAESVTTLGNRNAYEPGDVLVLTDTDGSDIKKSSEPYSTSVAGIYSTKPGVVGRRQSNNKRDAEIPMAMVGIVPTKVSAEGGPIKRGDLLVTSSTEGYAMKGTDRSQLAGAIVGKAMGNLTSGTGVIEVLVSLQ